MPPQEPPAATVVEAADDADAAAAADTDAKAVFHIDVGSVTQTALTSEEAERAVESLCKFVRYETVSATAPASGRGGVRARCAWGVTQRTAPPSTSVPGTTFQPKRHARPG